jgi:hypothetical protein
VTIIIGIVLLLVVIAIVVLFAMFGELASRVPKPVQPDQAVHAYSKARIDAQPALWPDPMQDFDIATRTDERVILVLSSSCTSCMAVADQVHAMQRTNEQALDRFVVLVSCDTLERGQAFLNQHALLAVHHYIDVGGTWVRENFNVSISPSALVIANGVLASALTFQDLTVLLEALDRSPNGKEGPWTESDESAPENTASEGEASSAPSVSAA